MDKILAEIEIIKEKIEDSREYKDYLYLKEKLDNNEKVKLLVEEIKSLQKLMVKKEHHKESIEKEENRLKEITTILNDIPLYNDYLETQERLNETLFLISNTLKEYFNNLTN